MRTFVEFVLTIVVAFVLAYFIVRYTDSLLLAFIVVGVMGLVRGITNARRLRGKRE